MVLFLTPVVKDTISTPSLPSYIVIPYLFLSKYLSYLFISLCMGLWFMGKWSLPTFTFLSNRNKKMSKN